MAAVMPPALFHRLFIANRGEVAARIARTCDRLGITPVFGVSEADRDAPYLAGRQQVVLGPARSVHSYLDAERVVQAAVQSTCTALHPGWGFLSEDPLLATLCGQHGVTFIGPPPAVMALMGKKTPAKRAARDHGLDVVPGSDGPVASLAEAAAIAEQVGYPLLIKAEAGGGGRGMRIAASRDQLASAYADAQREAAAAFGDPRVYVERLITGGHHVEIQVLADRWGGAIHLGERDCTVQRRHQKLIEESPSPVLSERLRQHSGELAARLVRRIGYVGAGTLEFLLDESGETLRFLEMNTRLQVEHAVTEERAGVDLVAAQIQIAAGRAVPWRQDEISLSGHVIECRINAEDPSRDFAPSPGRITSWQPPRGDGIRVETHVETGYLVPPHYDSLIAKVIARGADRPQAIERTIAALETMTCDGIATNKAMHLAILRSPAFRDGRYDTRAIPGWPA